MQWNTIISDSLIYHEAQRDPFQLMTEADDMVEDGVIYHVTDPVCYRVRMLFSLTDRDLRGVELLIKLARTLFFEVLFLTMGR